MIINRMCWFSSHPIMYGAWCVAYGELQLHAFYSDFENISEYYRVKLFAKATSKHTRLPSDLNINTYCLFNKGCPYLSQWWSQCGTVSNANHQRAIIHQKVKIANIIQHPLQAAQPKSTPCHSYLPSSNNITKSYNFLKHECTPCTTIYQSGCSHCFMYIATCFTWVLMSPLRSH